VPQRPEPVSANAEADLRRVRCRRCGVRTELVGWARTGSLFTRDFEDRVAGLTRVTDKTTVNRLFEISWVTVGRIVATLLRQLGRKAASTDHLRFIDAQKG